MVQPLLWFRNWMEWLGMEKEAWRKWTPFKKNCELKWQMNKFYVESFLGKSWTIEIVFSREIEAGPFIQYWNGGWIKRWTSMKCTQPYISRWKAMWSILLIGICNLVDLFLLFKNWTGKCEWKMGEEQNVGNESVSILKPKQKYILLFNFAAGIHHLFGLAKQKKGMKVDEGIGGQMNKFPVWHFFVHSIFLGASSSIIWPISL